MRNAVHLLMLTLVLASAAAAPITAAQAPAVTARDGAGDFDWEIGRWSTSVRVLRKPLSGDTDWVDFSGTSIVRSLAGGRANLVDLDIAGAGGRLRGVSLRLYNVAARQWSVHFANIGDGVLTPAVTGGFEGGRGEFHGADTLRGRAILVRFVIRDVTRDSARFEQSYSADGGRTWELNWVATDRRLPA